MTLYVWDNGKDYSDHSISFIECSWPDSAEVEQLLNALAAKSKGEQRGVIMTLRDEEAVTWRQPGRHSDLIDWLDDYDYLFDCPEDQKALNDLPDDFVGWIAEQLPNGGQWLIDACSREAEE